MRLFLAIGLPVALRRKISMLQRDLAAELAGWRWLRPQGIHLTLRFLGDLAPPQERELRVRWREAARRTEPLSLELGELGCFPPRGEPRVLWLAAQDRPTGTLAGLALLLEAAARQGGLPAEKRPFRGHLTLARAVRGSRVSRPRPWKTQVDGSMRVSEICLYESELRPDGARYTALERYTLGGQSVSEPRSRETRD